LAQAKKKYSINTFLIKKEKRMTTLVNTTDKRKNFTADQVLPGEACTMEATSLIYQRISISGDVLAPLGFGYIPFIVQPSGLLVWMNHAGVPVLRVDLMQVSNDLHLDLVITIHTKGFNKNEKTRYT
jgi:hypothetical protein